MAVRLPNNSQRTVIVGRTGTGKTVAGLWHLSNYSMMRPWIVLNFKDDEHIESINKAQHIDFDFVLDKKDEGLFVLRVLPPDTQGTLKTESRLERFLWKIWERGNCGLFVDECFSIGQNDAFDSILTQGRSKRIPVIGCTQRPVWVTRFLFSEADFIQVFHLNDERDRNTVEGFTPLVSEDFEQLGKHESYYYDIAENELAKFKPCPPMSATRLIFDEKLPRRRVRI